MYHSAESLLPLQDADFLMSSNLFCGKHWWTNQWILWFNTDSKQEIVTALQTLFDQHNKLIRLFRTALNQMPFDDYKIVDRAYIAPVR